MSPSNVVIPPTRSLGTAIIAALGALATLALAVALLFDPTVPASASPWLVLLAVLFTSAIGLVALRLGDARGGLFLDEAGERIGLGVTSSRDTWWLRRSEVTGVRTALDPRTERWLVVLEAEQRSPIVVAASEDRGQIVEITGLLAERTRLPLLTEETELEPHLQAASLRFGVRRGAALQGMLAAFGLALVAVGVVAFFQEDRFAAFLFGPLLLVIGLVLIAVPIVKRLAHEELSADGERLTHAFVFGRLRWGDRTIRATRPTCRIWLAGMRGAYLEVLGDEGSLVVGAGATATSALDLEGLSRLPAQLVAPR